MEVSNTQDKEDLLRQKAMLEEEIRKNPYISGVHVRLAEIYEKLFDFIGAYKHCKMAFFLYEYNNDTEGIVQTSNYLEKITKEINIFAENLEGEDLKSFYKQIESLNEQERNVFGLAEPAFRSIQKVIGKYWNNNQNIFLGGFRMPIQLYDKEEMDLVHMCGEFVQAYEGNRIRIGGNGEYLLPIATEEDMTEHIFLQDGESQNVMQTWGKRFHYYKIKGGTEIYSAKKSFYGNPIPLKIDPKKKKLVLNIFVDGLAQCAVQGDKLEIYMPNTYHFFKKGMICTSAHCAGEWTYPSIANYVSGRYTTDHMMFHNMIDWHLPEETPLLAEYFHNEGYYTCYMGGDWRIIPTYGHARGYDRFLYQIQHNGFHVEQVVSEAIGQIEAMKETNQFLWITIGDLHDIADKLELPTYVQTHLELGDQHIEQSGPTSVKQGYSECKIRQYETMLPYIDIYLGILFQYLESHYSDEEMTVSLFADHGQGYFVPENGEFLGNERTNVAMMFRDCSCHDIQTGEIISSVDYTAIMCKLAGILYDEKDTAGKLPRILGGSGRKWALVESLHPGDPFRAALYGESYTFFFLNNSPVGNDGRFILVNYETKLINKFGEIVEEEDVRKECVNIILEKINHLILK